ncbi:hypothetical protein G5T42_10905 [Microbacterium sp. 4R-513]|uniref:sensor histidine kinase n=1 Tax=Microbacterium sp. 4R-513 TaxID=2567934 RepID=UPI0013E12277|nr:histidine kinase [Microbacterium sp. 4R-513]QIG39932.1 hypothetical protein G5T42_10905 [Microbacterium sp. 4R-513]
MPAADAGRSPGAIARIRSAARYREEASITVEDRPWGVLAVDRISAPGDDLSSRLKPFADLTAIAIANARNRESLTRSRARIVAAGDDARRRLQRDLHDGAQQRLVHAILSLKLARETARAGEPVLDLLDEAIESAVDANRELRDLVRGILPAALSRAGLVGGIESFVSDVPLPVELRLSIPRLPPTLETTGYFLVAEALTNTVKHANATMARVEASIADEGEELVIVITDDGIGGADPGRGTGLTGLLDRVDAGGGALSIISPVGMGTTLTARLPLPSPGFTGASAPHPAD